MQTNHATKEENQFQGQVLATYNEIKLSPEEESEALRLARKAKFHEQKIQEWRRKINEPPKEIKVTKDEYREYLLRTFPEFDFKLQEQQFNFLLEYFTAEEQTKGLLLYGGVGCGKTTLMNLFRQNPLSTYFLVPCRDIANKYSQSGHEEIKQYYDIIKANYPPVFKHEYYSLCFDDLGEEATTKHFGNQMNVMEDILLARYNKRNLWSKTYITTNLTGEQIEQLYGLRIRSRMREMFHIIKFENIQDLRK